MCQYNAPIGSKDWEENLKCMSKKELIEYIKFLYEKCDITPKDLKDLDNPLFKYEGI